MAKMGHKMVALCAATIGIIYSAGYLVTEPAVLAQDSQPAIVSTQSISNVLAANTPTPQTQIASDLNVPVAISSTPKAQNPSNLNVPATNTSIPKAPSTSHLNVPVTSKSTVNTQIAPNSASPIPKATSTPVSSTPSSVAAQGQYRDGTYNGQGSNRIGTVEVAVTVNQGKIISCEIINCSTHYSVTAIDPVLPNEVVKRQSGNVDVVTGATKSTQDFQTAVQEALAQARV